MRLAAPHPSFFDLNSYYFEIILVNELVGSYQDTITTNLSFLLQIELIIANYLPSPGL